jgi:hypothetical protein
MGDYRIIRNNAMDINEEETLGYILKNIPAFIRSD